MRKTITKQGLYRLLSKRTKIFKTIIQEVLEAYEDEVLDQFSKPENADLHIFGPLGVLKLKHIKPAKKYNIATHERYTTKPNAKIKLTMRSSIKVPSKY